MRTIATMCTALLLVVRGPSDITRDQERDGYYIVRQGAHGYSVRAVGHATTECAAGVVRAVCQVARIETSALRVRAGDRPTLDDAFDQGYAIARGTLGATLVVSELWAPRADTRPMGGYYRVRDSGVRCITTPCPTLRAEPLQGGAPTNVDALDLDAIEPADSLRRAVNRMLVRGSVIVAGTVRDAPRDGGRRGGRTLVASQLFTPVGWPATTTQPPG